MQKFSPTAFRSLLALAVASLTLCLGLAPAQAKQPGKQSKHSRVGLGGDSARGKIGLDQNRALGSKRRKRAKAKAKPEPEAASSSQLPPGVLFHGDEISDFRLAQSAPGAISEVADPAGSGQSVFQMTVNDNDVYPVTPTENPRAELIADAPIFSGQEIWWSARFFLPADFPSSTPDFVTLVQGPYGRPWNGTPPFHIGVNGGVIRWQRNSTYGWDVPFEMPLVRNAWVNVLVHERFGPDGWLELWINGQPITFFAGDTYNPNDVAPTQHLEMATMDRSNNLDDGNAVYLQSYRRKGMYPSLTIYHGPLTIGTSREAIGA